jgi:hypothetical protein
LAVAVIEQVPTLLTVTTPLVWFTVHAVEAVLYENVAPATPPLALAVYPFGYVTVGGTVSVTAGCVATVAFTVAGADGGLSL